MSVAGAEYYHERAKEFHIRARNVPDLLDGEPLDLSEPTEAVAVHATDSETAIAIGARLEDALETLRPFILKTLPGRPRSLPDAENLGRANKNFTAGFIGTLLVPKALKTGRVSGISVEAIARDEVNDAALRRVKFDSYRDAHPRDSEKHEVYLSVDGTLRSGSRTMTAGGLVVVRAVRLVNPRGTIPNYITGIHFGGTPFNDNEKEALRIQRESQAVSDAVTEHNMRTAYQNAIGTNRRGRGKGK